MENLVVISRWFAIIYSFIQWFFQFTNGQDTSTQSGGINFGTPLPTLTPQDLPPAYYGPQKCSIM